MDAVEAAWAATDPITLDNPVTELLGIDLTQFVLDYEQSAYPVVSVMATSREGATPAAQWGYQEVAARIVIDFAVQSETLEETPKIGWRYARAIRQTLQSQKQQGDLNQEDYEPTLALTNVEKTYDANASPDDIYYVQVGRLEVPLG